MNEIEQAIRTYTDKAIAVAGEFTTVWLPVQLGLILLAAALAALAAALVRRRVDLISLTMGWPAYARIVVRTFVANLGPIIFIVLAVVLHAGMEQATWPSRSYLLGVAVNLATAWVVISLLASVIRNQFVNHLVAISAWTIAALSILDLLGPTAAALDSISIVIGGVRITPLLILKTAAFLLITLWAAASVSNFLDKRVRALTDLTPSIQVLLAKLIRLALITLAIIVVVSSVGIDLSALALFSGAIGVGIGFGLQKTVSNLVSGIILLADKSIKPGDVISVGESFGWVDTMGARYTSVVARDGREYLIPNEDFVTQRVINWSYSNDRVRIDVDFGVSYHADPHRVRQLAIEAVVALPRILKEPSPVCHLTAFGDSSLNFMIRFWIRDPVDGVTNIRGDVLLALWDAFKRDGIEIPFPQRDINMRTPVQVVVERGEMPASGSSRS